MYFLFRKHECHIFFCVQVQFVLIFSHQLQVLFRPSCQYPRVFVYWIAMHGFLFLFLFSDFYKARYKSKKERTTARTNGLCMVSSHPVMIIIIFTVLFSVASKAIA